MQPIKNRILVRQIVEEIVVEEVKEGEIAKPPVASNGTIVAEVLGVGPLVEEVKKGNRVAFSPYGYDEIVVDGEKLMVIGEDLILGIYAGK